MLVDQMSFFPGVEFDWKCMMVWEWIHHTQAGLLCWLKFVRMRVLDLSVFVPEIDTDEGVGFEGKCMFGGCGIEQIADRYDGDLWSRIMQPNV